MRTSIDDRGDPKAAQTAVQAEIARIPKVQGSGSGQPQITPELVRVLDNAQQTATKAGDEYVAQDRLLVALAASDTPAGKALKAAGATAQALDKAVDLLMGEMEAESRKSGK